MNLVIPHRLLTFVVFLGLNLCSNTWAENSSEPETTRLWSMADSYWGTQEMTEARREVLAASGGWKNFMVMADRFEVQLPDGDEVFLWDAQGWYGSDINKLFIKTEGEYSFDSNKFEDAEVQALWSRAVAPFWLPTTKPSSGDSSRR